MRSQGTPFGTTFKTLSLAVHRSPHPTPPHRAPRVRLSISAHFSALPRQNQTPSLGAFVFPLLSDAFSSGCACLRLHRPRPGSNTLPSPQCPVPSWFGSPIPSGPLSSPPPLRTSPMQNSLCCCNLCFYDTIDQPDGLSSPMLQEISQGGTETQP